MFPNQLFWISVLWSTLKFQLVIKSKDKRRFQNVVMYHWDTICHFTAEMKLLHVSLGLVMWSFSGGWLLQPATSLGSGSLWPVCLMLKIPGSFICRDGYGIWHPACVGLVQHNSLWLTRSAPNTWTQFDSKVCVHSLCTKAQSWTTSIQCHCFGSCQTPVKVCGDPVVWRDMVSFLHATPALPKLCWKNKTFDSPPANFFFYTFILGPYQL